jgi:hypothetical protein
MNKSHKKASLAITKAGAIFGDPAYNCFAFPLLLLPATFKSKTALSTMLTGGFGVYAVLKPQFFRGIM